MTTRLQGSTHLIRGWFALPLVLAATLWAGCAGRPLPGTLRNTIEPGANVLVLERESPTANEQTPYAFIADARRRFSVQRYQLAEDDKEQLRLVTRPQQIGDGLAVRIQVRAEAKPDGSRLLGMAEYAPSTTSTNWQPARWTTERSNERRAFLEMVDVLTEIDFNRIGATVDTNARIETITR